MEIKRNDICPHSGDYGPCSRCSLSETFGIEKSLDVPKTKLEQSFADIGLKESVIVTNRDTEIEESGLNFIEQPVNMDDLPAAQNCETIVVNDNSTIEEPVVTKPLVDPPSWTLRLISSEQFNVQMAIEYLHTIHDKPSLTCLGRRLFDLPQDEIDSFLPQLMYMYVNKIDAASVTHAYIEDRNKRNPQFAIICTWLLDCFIATANPLNPPNHALMLRAMLRNEISTDENERSPENDKKIRVLSTLSLDNLKESDWITSKPRKSVSSSNLEGAEVVIEASGVEEKDVNKITLSRELSTKELLTCENKFIERLMQIGKRLMIDHIAETKQEKMAALKIELQMLNAMLPAPAWIPFEPNHTILGVCYNDCAVLNSKDKVPYIMFAEVIRLPVNFHTDVPQKKFSVSQQEKRAASKSKRIKVYHDTSDPSAAVFAESWTDKKNRIRSCSNYGGHKDWDLIPVIVKFGDDLSQEAFAQQLLQTFKDIWNEEGVPLYLRPYKIVCVGPDAGLIEPVLDTLSLHQIKRHLMRIFRQNGNLATPTLRHHFEDMFGPPASEAYVNAQKNFIQSAAAYSLVSYFLQLKDRHNGNILLDLEGHLIHIDYGFLLSASPKNLGFETAPFKLTSELIDVMGGIDSDMFLYYKSLLLRGVMTARKHHRRIVSLAEIMSQGSKMQCFRAGPETVRTLELRFHVSSTDEQLQQLVDALVDGSRDSYTTRFYDSFQYYTNGIH